MTTINFVSKDNAAQEQILKIRHLVMAITTGVLVVYLVCVAGVFGWWWYGSSQQRRSSAEIDNLVLDLRGYTDAEVAARQLAARSDAITAFLTNRGNASDAANILVGATDMQVIDWEYDVSGSQKVQVKVSGPEQILTFSNYLQDKYNKQQVDEIGWDMVNGWTGRFLISGRKGAHP